VAGFGIFGRVATFALCNEADLGSLTLRLAGSPPEASPAALLRRSLGWLPVERAIDRVTSFHVTRTARLGLAHRKHERTKTRKMNSSFILFFSSAFVISKFRVFVIL
jgi:hypothetical protein